MSCLQPFHAYTSGNLDWTAAFENESATQAIAWRAMKQPELTGPQAENQMRDRIFNSIDVSLPYLFLVLWHSVVDNPH